ncbi:hypothetical protein [Malonomonas rubra]|uniref:hypothetical protein n=1 Tax=Malonomonas rubra TaxID=57040 RepID=UPI0026F24748|nr:hypothetical protein [Malonomonas rubra]
MKKKVWMLDDGEPSSWLDFESILVPEAAESIQVINTPVTKKQEKSPVTAFSLSLLVWGSGHFYLEKNRPGYIYLSLMGLYFIMGTALILFHQEFALFAAERLHVLLVGGVLVVLGLLIWGSNAVDAYYRAKRLQSTPFLGLEQKRWPVCASLLVPGWGQFLNSQPKKGIFFLSFALVGYLALLILTIARPILPLLVTEPLRNGYEVALIITLVAIPPVLLFWVLAVNDAYRSCEDFLHNKRLSVSAGRRLSSRNVLVDLTPSCSAVLGFMLAISLGMQFLPREYYSQYLTQIKGELLANKLIILPELVGRVLALLSQ